MAAATAGRWSEIVEHINYWYFTPADDEEAGRAKLSAISITDCIDGERDIGPEIGGTDATARNDILFAWSTAPGRTAMPTEEIDLSPNDYERACKAGGAWWYQNTAPLAPSTNYAWLAALNPSTSASTGPWTTQMRRIGYNACGSTSTVTTESAGSDSAMRAVIRGPEPDPCPPTPVGGVVGFKPAMWGEYCYYEGEVDHTCTMVCNALGLACYPQGTWAYWGIAGMKQVCGHFHPDAASVTTSGSAGAPYYDPVNLTCYANSGSNNACDTIMSGKKRICVCK
jgi:hypothetical protein